MSETPAAAKPACVLVLQGGGALGAYHIGAYQALREARFEPDWICGTSVGAFNAAVIAGNPPDRRLERLTAFWDAISWPDILPPLSGIASRTWADTFSYVQALAFGQPGFFTPRPLNPYLAPPGVAATSFYDTAPLRPTLESVSDFDLLNRGATRLSVSATDVETGRLVFFDTKTIRGRLGPEHIIASGSLPPGFPATPIGGRLYWDGACVSNTPLEAVLDDPPPGHAVAFMIDLWSAGGPPPTTMDEVQWRAAQIQYASRIAHHVDSVATKVNLRHATRLLREGGLGAPEAAATAEQRLDIVHIIYQPGADQIPASAAEFSRPSIAERRAAGYADMRRALEGAPWRRTQKPAHLGCVVHRVAGGRITTLAEPNLGDTTDRMPPALAVVR